MNVKLITKAMHTLSLLSEDDVAMVMKLRGLSEDERQMLMLVLEPNAKSAKKPTKKPAGTGGGGKSARASGMAEQLNKQLDGRRQEQTEPIIADDSERCQFMSPAGGRCGGTRDDNQHHLYTRAGYHQFVAPPATHAATGSAGD